MSSKIGEAVAYLLVACVAVLMILGTVAACYAIVNAAF